MKNKSKGKEYRLGSTGNWIVSPSAQKLLDKIEHRKNKRHHKGQKKK